MVAAADQVAVERDVELNRKRVNRWADRQPALTGCGVRRVANLKRRRHCHIKRSPV